MDYVRFSHMGVLKQVGVSWSLAPVYDCVILARARVDVEHPKENTIVFRQVRRRRLPTAELRRPARPHYFPRMRPSVAL